MVLLGIIATLYDLASSPRFQVSQVSIAGNQTLTTEEIEAAAGAVGRNLFWVRTGEVTQRLRLLPPVESAAVHLELPDRVRIQVKEREPVVIWLSGETPFLVDADGLVLAAREPARALMVVRDTSNQALRPGSRVNTETVRNLGKVDAFLSQAFGAQPRQYEYAGGTGLNVTQSRGPRLVLGNGEQVENKVATIQTIVRHLEATQTTADLIDVRFGDRPYYR